MNKILINYITSGDLMKFLENLFHKFYNFYIFLKTYFINALLNKDKNYNLLKKIFSFDFSYRNLTILITVRSNQELNYLEDCND